MNEKQKKIFMSYAEDISHILCVATPKIRFTTNKGEVFDPVKSPARTNMTIDSIQKKVVKMEVVFFDGDAISDLQYLISLAHEMRHVWQYQHLPYEKLTAFVEQGRVESEEYSSQELEIDADAFALAYVEDLLEEKMGSKMEIPDSNQPIWKVYRSI